MDTSNHQTMRSLFEQLGLPAESEQIKDFIKQHPLLRHEQIEKASFWSRGQAAFIEESISDDSDWSVLVDQLDAQLRH
jgi:hypothetical protein